MKNIESIVIGKLLRFLFGYPTIKSILFKIGPKYDKKILQEN